MATIALRAAVCVRRENQETGEGVGDGECGLSEQWRGVSSQKIGKRVTGRKWWRTISVSLSRELGLSRLTSVSIQMLILG